MNRIAEATTLMEAFARRTGLVGDERPNRYLWTDAFAVCNFLGLADAGHPDTLRMAVDLVDQVHAVLGSRIEADGGPRPLGSRHAEGDPSPTGAGLRIGKPLPERATGEPFDERLEWERDGQYFHYLTRWMHALARVAEATGDSRYHRWAVDLSETAFDAFVVRGSDGRAVRMVWKMSVDLDRPLVSSMGHHDPLDGWITARVLAASPFSDAPQKRALHQQAATYHLLARRGDWATGDPLGIGGLLVNAWCLRRAEPDCEPETPAALLAAAAHGLVHVHGGRLLDAPPRSRLGFRELGLSIGLHAAGRLVEAFAGRDADSTEAGELRTVLETIRPSLPLGGRIERTWLVAGNRRSAAWADHRDINDVMLATSLVPDGYLGATSTTHRMAVSGGVTT